MWEYTDKVREHFLNPRNVGEIEDPDGVAEVGSIACGDALKFTFKLDENNKISEARFKTFGCASAIASASALTEMVKGKTLEEARNISNKDIAEFLGGLPEEKMHCSVLGQQALEMAIQSVKGTPAPEPGSEIICECFGITAREIEKAVRENGLATVEQVTNYTKAGGGCGNCQDRIKAIIERVQASASPVAQSEAKTRLTNLKKIRLIEDVMEREIRPSLQQDGGDIDLIDVVDNRVIVAVRGSCATCPASQATLKGFVETKLRETVSPELIVEEEA
jgi:NifU-like protein